MIAVQTNGVSTFKQWQKEKLEFSSKINAIFRFAFKIELCKLFILVCVAYNSIEFYPQNYLKTLWKCM